MPAPLKPQEFIDECNRRLRANPYAPRDVCFVLRPATDTEAWSFDFTLGWDDVLMVELVLTVYRDFDVEE